MVFDFDKYVNISSDFVAYGKLAALKIVRQKFSLEQAYKMMQENEGSKSLSQME